MGIFVEIEILDGSFYENAFELFAGTLSWAVKQAKHVGTREDNLDIDGPYSFVTFISTKTGMNLPLNLINHENIADFYLTEGRFVYEKNSTEVLMEKGENIGLLGFLPLKNGRHSLDLPGSSNSYPIGMNNDLLSKNVSSAEYLRPRRDPVGVAPGVQDSIKKSPTSYWKGIDKLAVPYLPYVSNCAGFDSFIPMFELMENPMCRLLPPEETNPTKSNDPGYVTNETDFCMFSLPCSHEDTEQTNGGNFEWHQMNMALGQFFFISRHPMPLSYYDYTGFNPSAITGGTLYKKESSLFELVPVMVQNTEPVALDSRPTRVQLRVGIYQESSTKKSAAEAQLEYFDYVEGATDYTFEFQMFPLTWIKVLDQFSFSMFIPIMVVTLLGAIVLFMILVVWKYGQSISVVIPRPKVAWGRYYRLVMGPASMGFIYAMIPSFACLLAIMTIMEQEKGLDILKQFPADRNMATEMDSNMESTYNFQRFGFMFAIIGWYMLIEAGVALVPVPQKERVGIYSPNVWNRMHFYLWKLVFIGLCTAIVLGTRQPFYKQNVIIMQVVFTGIQAVFSILISSKLPDRLAFTSFAMAKQIVNKTSALGVATFTQFTIQYFVQLGTSISVRAIAPALTRLALATVNRIKKKKKLQRIILRLAATFLPEETQQKIKDQLSGRKPKVTKDYLPAEIEHQERAVRDLFKNSILFVSQMFGPTFTFFVFIFARILGIETAFGGQDLVFYVIFGTIMLVYQFMYDLFVMNYVEMAYGWKLNQYLDRANQRFNARTSLWVLEEKLSQSADQQVAKELRKIDQMGFSQQFYFLTSFTTFGTLIAVYGKMVFIYKNYNPFADNFALPIAFFTIATCYAIKICVLKTGDLMSIWSRPGGDLDPEDPDILMANQKQQEKAKGKKAMRTGKATYLGTILQSDEDIMDFRMNVQKLVDTPGGITPQDLAIRIHKYTDAKLFLSHKSSAMMIEAESGGGLLQGKAKKGRRGSLDFFTNEANVDLTMVAGLEGAEVGERAGISRADMEAGGIGLGADMNPNLSEKVEIQWPDEFSNLMFYPGLGGKERQPGGKEKTRRRRSAKSRKATGDKNKSEMQRRGSNLKKKKSKRGSSFRLDFRRGSRKEANPLMVTSREKGSRDASSERSE